VLAAEVDGQPDAARARLDQPRHGHANRLDRGTGLDREVVDGAIDEGSQLRGEALGISGLDLVHEHSVVGVGHHAGCLGAADVDADCQQGPTGGHGAVGRRGDDLRDAHSSALI
jgi:hypothetical protein